MLGFSSKYLLLWHSIVHSELMQDKATYAMTDTLILNTSSYFPLRFVNHKHCQYVQKRKKRTGFDKTYIFHSTFVVLRTFACDSLANTMFWLKACVPSPTVLYMPIAKKYLPYCTQLSIHVPFDSVVPYARTNKILPHMAFILAFLSLCLLTYSDS